MAARTPRRPPGVRGSRRTIQLALMALAVTAAGCGRGAALPTVKAVPGIPLLCPTAAYEPFWLRIDEGQVFGAWQVGGERLDLTWPSGFYVGRDSAGAAVHDPEGRIVARDDQLITNAGGADGVICTIGGRGYELP